MSGLLQPQHIHKDKLEGSCGTSEPFSILSPILPFAPKDAAGTGTTTPAAAQLLLSELKLPWVGWCHMLP